MKEPELFPLELLALPHQLNQQPRPLQVVSQHLPLGQLLQENLPLLVSQVLGGGVNHSSSPPAQGGNSEKVWTFTMWPGYSGDLEMWNQ